MKKSFLLLLFFVMIFYGLPLITIAQTIKILNNETTKNIVFGNDKINISLNYNGQANINSLVINGEQVCGGSAGIYSAIKTATANYSSLQLLSVPNLTVTDNTIQIAGIIYGDRAVTINETWTFTVYATSVGFDIERTFTKPIVAEQVASPVFIFNSINTWEGAYQDYGGIAWFYLFNKKLDTYGVHSSSSQFWNSKNGNGFTVSVDATGNNIAMDYSRTADDKLAFKVAIAKEAIIPRFDSATNRRRFIRDTTTVWAPFKISVGTTTQHINLSWFDFKQQYGRGKLVGVNAEQVSGVLNTIARIGVIDKQHFGGNSWHTPYGPICLHEQYIAQLGIAINDQKYLDGYRDCLDFYRDNAIKPDGRVFSRWAYSNEDAMPDGFNNKGFYEAQWGYLMDANPDFVTNVAELYNQNGDAAWVKTQQVACEKVLDWITDRDSNNNGLVEMITDSHKEKRGSDWIDIIWAAYENAFVNAKLFHALILWADVEKQLGNSLKEKYYRQFAGKLKNSFNKPVTAGGFWDAEKKCYIHWRDKDGSIHGNNMVTPVNFMAIAYGICDDKSRTGLILDAIEIQMQKEQLFFWPLCMYSYKEGEGNDWQFPFPNYENGDIFLSWGSVAVKAYATYKPAIAVKYIKNVLAQYAKDGLAYQRYGRLKQDGLGDDILSGNSLAVVGLYQAVYGINPKYNRLYLEPHITDELSGTQLRYNYRNQQLVIGLDKDRYSISNGRFTIKSNYNFGFFSKEKQLLFFNRNNVTASLKITIAGKGSLVTDIKKCTPTEVVFTQSIGKVSTGNLSYQVNDLKPDHVYDLLINDKTVRQQRSNKNGSITFTYTPTKATFRLSILSR